MATLAYGRFYGDTIAAFECEDFLISQTVHEPNLHVEPHRHATPYFCLVISGGFQEQSSLGGRFCGPASLLYHSDGHWHEDVLSKNGAICLNIQLKNGQNLSRSFLSSAGPLAWHATSLLSRFQSGNDVGEAVASLLNAAADKPHAVKAPSWLLQIRKSVQKRYGETVSLDSLAHDAGVHPLYLTRMYRRYFGQSVGEHLRMVRAKEAAARLAAGVNGLAEIATICGFYDQSHFTNIFKRQTGFTPSQFRNAYRGQPSA